MAFRYAGIIRIRKKGSGAKEPNLFGMVISNGLIRWQPRGRSFREMFFDLLSDSFVVQSRCWIVNATISCFVKINESLRYVSVTIIVTYKIQIPPFF